MYEFSKNVTSTTTNDTFNINTRHYDAVYYTYTIGTDNEAEAAFQIRQTTSSASHDECSTRVAWN